MSVNRTRIRNATPKALTSRDAARDHQTRWRDRGVQEARRSLSGVNGPRAQVRLASRVAGRDDVPIGGDRLGEGMDTAAGSGAAVEDHSAGFTVEGVELGA